MPRKFSLSTDNILRFLQLRNEPASASEIAKGLGLKDPDTRPLFKLLAKLENRQAIEALPGGRYGLPGRKPDPVPDSRERAKNPPAQKRSDSSLGSVSRDELAGRLILHPDGYGFVVLDTPLPRLDGDVYIPRNAIEDVMHGDHVLVKIQRRGGVPGAERAEGRIVRILDRAHPTIVGLFRYGAQGNVVLPYDTRIQHEVVIPPGHELTPDLAKKVGSSGFDQRGLRGRRIPRMPELDGAVVNVELTRFPRGGAAPSGRVIEILGRPGELGVDTEIIIRKHHLPHLFSNEVMEEAELRAKPVSETERADREDFRHLPIVTIDGETARDFDDAVYVERRANGWHLQVHIADVAHYVRTSTVLDREARLRGTSVYFPDRAVPMLPEALSNGMCSLKPREDRLVMSVLMEFDAAGNQKSSRMTPGVIRSAERMTYTDVNKVCEGDAERTERYAKLAHHFRAMKVMLAANRGVASYLLKRGIESLHRVHEKPDARKVLEFEELARAFGYSLGVEDLRQREIAVRHGRVPAPAKAGRPDSYGRGRERAMRVALPGGELRITPQHYQRLIRKIVGKPEERILSYLMLRSLKQARYAADSLGHFALGFDEYTHFTSPIRRYPDLIVHRILKWALEHRSETLSRKAHIVPPRGSEAALYSHTSLEEIAAETSEAERRADAAERELMDWKTAQFMEEHLGEEYEGLIVSVQKFGCFVELFEVFVEGLLPISALEEAANARCVYRERDHSIIALVGTKGGAAAGSSRGHSAAAHRRGQSGPTGKDSRSVRDAKSRPLEWHLGDRVRVRADRIDPMRKRVEFAVIS
ncbi:MAG: ribonuclease R [Acidobacteria bacterium]|nr:MAG: ribonuclease R [Acidobacteriota bacterium]